MPVVYHSLIRLHICTIQLYNHHKSSYAAQNPHRSILKAEWRFQLECLIDCFYSILFFQLNGLSGFEQQHKRNGDGLSGFFENKRSGRSHRGTQMNDVEMSWIMHRKCTTPKGKRFKVRIDNKNDKYLVLTHTLSFCVWDMNTSLDKNRYNNNKNNISAHAECMGVRSYVCLYRAAFVFSFYFCFFFLVYNRLHALEDKRKTNW